MSASLVLASTSALAGPDDPAAKKKPKTSVTKKASKKATPKPAAEPEAAPAAVAPETKAADTKPAEAAPVPVASTASPSRAEADHGASSRHRDEGDSGKAFAVAPLLGFGTNQFNFGLGARAGYTLPMKLYLGGTFMYHLGASYGAGFGGAEASFRAFYPAGEVGYDFHVGPVTIRPYGGVGLAFLTVSSSYLGQSQSATENSLVLFPGATAHWNIPRSDFFVGGDTRIVILTRGGDPSFGLFATAGMKF